MKGTCTQVYIINVYFKEKQYSENKNTENTEMGAKSEAPIHPFQLYAPSSSGYNVPN